VNDAGDKKEGVQQLMRAWERCGKRGRATRQHAGDKAGDKAGYKTCEAGNDFWKRGGGLASLRNVGRWRPAAAAMAKAVAEVSRE